MDHRKSWLNVGSKLEHILDIVDTVPLPLLQLLGFMWNRATEHICSCNGTSPLRFLQTECPSSCPINSIKALKQYTTTLASSVQASDKFTKRQNKNSPLRFQATCHKRTKPGYIFLCLFLCRSKINTQKTKARFSRLLRHPAWEWRGSILITALNKFVTYLLTYLHTACQ